MNRDAQIIQQVEDALDGKGSSFGMTMTTTWVKEEGKEAELRMISKRVGGPDPSLPLEELERNADIARVRYLFACEQQAYSKKYWQDVVIERSQEFNNAVITFHKKKYQLTDSDLERDWSQNASGVFEKKDENK